MNSSVILNLLDSTVINGFFVCVSVALLCIGAAMLIDVLKN